MKRSSWLSVLMAWGVVVGGYAVGADGPASGPGRPAAALNGRWWEGEPGWSKEVEGLKVQLTGGKYLTAKIGMEVSLRFWNTLGEGLIVCANDPMCVEWKVRDGQGNVVAAERAGDWEEQTKPTWLSLGPQVSGRGTILGSPEENRKGRLKVGGVTWKLGAGEYTLRGVFVGPSAAAGKPERGGRVWVGEIELVPLSFTVIEVVTVEQLRVAAGKINQQQWAGVGERYAALAGLIRIGATYRELQIVLPPVPDAKGGIGRMHSFGNIIFGTYGLGGGYSVDFAGFGQREEGGEAEMVLSVVPKIKGPGGDGAGESK